MYFLHQLKAILATCVFGLFCCTGAIAQETTPTTQTTPLASALLNNGWAEAHLVSATRDGDKLLVRIRFKASEGVSGSENIYSGMSKSKWESDFYIVAGDKKYLLMKDSAGHPLAPQSLTLNTSKGPQAGSWSGTFAAPPAGEQATLHIDGIEPLGPFAVP